MHALRAWLEAVVLLSACALPALGGVPAAASLAARMPAAGPACTQWRIVPGDARGLVAASAASSVDVWAVGTVQIAGHDAGSVQRWDGSRWKIVPGASPAGSDARLLGVTAVSPSDVWVDGVAYATGSTTAMPLLEHWNGARWSRATGLGSGFTLNAVAAVSGSDVWAAGGYTGGRGGTVALHWDGRSWRSTASPASQNGTLNGLVAVATGDVWAVGETVGSTVKPLVEHWDGRQWLAIPLPPISGQIARLTAVAGVSSGDLWAVGYTGSAMATSGKPLVLHRAGTAWHVVAGTGGPQTGFSSVAAVSTRDVWAAGGTAIAHWDGTRWVEATVPEGGATAMAALGPLDVWSIGARFAHESGSLCAAGAMTVHTVSLPAVGTRDGGMAPLPDGPGALVLDPARGRAFVRDGDGQIDVVDTKNERAIAGVKLSASGAMALDEKSGRLYVPAGAAGLALLDATTGARLGAPLTLPAPSQVAVDAMAGRLLVLEPGAVAILDMSGALESTVPISNPSNLVVDARANRAFVSGDVSSPYPGMNVAGPNTSLLVLDATTGTVVHRVAGIGGPTDVDEKRGQVFVGYVDASATEKIAVLDAASGLVRHEFGLGSDGDAFLSSLAEDPASGTVYAATYFGLQALDPATGRVSMLDPSTPTAIAVDPSRGLLYASFAVNRNHYGIPIDPGELAAFDVTTGARRVTIRVGIGPDTVGVDLGSGDVFVLDTSGIEMVHPSGDRPIAVPATRPSDAAPPSPGARYFASAHHNMSGQFLQYWTAYGGLAALGSPVSEPFVQDAHLSQYLERALLQRVNGRLVSAPVGRLLTSGRAFSPVPAVPSTAARRYFPQTHHTLSGRFLGYWNAHHGDILLGAPISEVAPEANGDGTGREYPTQWFENGRLEYHAEHAGTAYAVEAGLVGMQDMREQSWFK